MSETNETTAPRRRRWIWPVLILSLALNFVIIGIVIGALSQIGTRDGRVDGPARSLLGEPFVRALEREDRRALGVSILRNRDALRQNRTELRAIFEDVLTELRNEEFDRNAISELLGAQRGLAVARQDIGERLLLDRLEAMSAQERQAYADRLADSLRRFRRD